MPVAAPIGYYSAADYSGLGLWAVNFSPYLYLAFDGIWRRPRTYEKRNEPVSARSQARYYFALYEIAAGGMSLFADAAATKLKGAQVTVKNSRFWEIRLLPRIFRLSRAAPDSFTAATVHGDISIIILIRCFYTSLFLRTREVLTIIPRQGAMKKMESVTEKKCTDMPALLLR